MDDEEVDRYRSLCAKIVNSYNPDYTFHDFRVVKGDTHTNLIFDLVVPHQKNLDKQAVIDDISALFKAENEKLNVVMTIEHSFA